MDWIRKHLLDLTDLCKNCEADPKLTMAQRAAFAEAYLTTAQFSSLPNAGGVHNLATAITKLCGACQGTIQRGCSGRSHWKQTCPLLHEHMNR